MKRFALIALFLAGITIPGASDFVPDDTVNMLKSPAQINNAQLLEMLTVLEELQVNSNLSFIDEFYKIDYHFSMKTYKIDTLIFVMDTISVKSLDTIKFSSNSFLKHGILSYPQFSDFNGKVIIFYSNTDYMDEYSKYMSEN